MPASLFFTGWLEEQSQSGAVHGPGDQHQVRDPSRGSAVRPPTGDPGQQRWQDAHRQQVHHQVPRHGRRGGLPSAGPDVRHVQGMKSGFIFLHVNFCRIVHLFSDSRHL